MSRGTYVLRDGQLVPKHLAPPLTPRGPRSSLPRPFVIGDCCEVVSMADGKTYTSKSKYRADIRARGLVEVGNDPSFTPERARPPVDDLPPVEADVAQAIEQLS